MKTVLTNDQGFEGLENVKFPVAVKCKPFCDGYTTVSKRELVRVGADSKAFSDGVPLLFEIEGARS